MSPHRRTDPSHPPRPPARQRSRAHRDVRDAGLLVLLADGGVAGPLVEAPGASPGRAARPRPRPRRPPRRCSSARTAAPCPRPRAAASAAIRPIAAVPSPREQQPAGGDDAAGVVAAEHVHRGRVARRPARSPAGRPARRRRPGCAARRPPASRAGRGDRRGGPLTPAARPAGQRPAAGTSRKRRSMSACSRTGSSSEPVLQVERRP